MLPLTLKEAEQQLVSRLRTIYEEREAETIASMTLEHISSLPKLGRVLDKSRILTVGQYNQLQKLTTELMAHRPVQYVLEEAWFCGLKFFVNEFVLIPRPETEELVRWVEEEVLSVRPGSLLDIGTGSGCIAVTLKKKLPSWEVHSCDISKEAIGVAIRNGGQQQTSIDFRQIDFLNRDHWPSLPAPDIIVSNPPYIPVGNKNQLSYRVSGYEPAMALFVPDDNSLIFYKAITEFAKIKLNTAGKIFVELQDGSSQSVALHFRETGFSNIEIRKDMQGMERMLKASMLP